VQGCSGIATSFPGRFVRRIALSDGANINKLLYNAIKNKKNRQKRLGQTGTVLMGNPSGGRLAATIRRRVQRRYSASPYERLDKCSSAIHPRNRPELPPDATSPAMQRIFHEKIRYKGEFARAAQLLPRHWDL